MFNLQLANTSPTHAYLHTAMQDIACDRFMNSSFEQIVSAKSSNFRSTGHASEVCSLLTAYRVLNIIYALEHPNALKAPIHQHLHVDFSSFKVWILVFIGCYYTYITRYLGSQTSWKLENACRQILQKVWNQKEGKCLLKSIDFICFMSTLCIIPSTSYNEPQQSPVQLTIGSNPHCIYVGPQVWW